MKLKALLVSITVIIMGLLAACGNNTANPDLTANGLLQVFLETGLPVADMEEFTAETCPNNLLGRPGEYTAKINFNDDRYPHFGSPDLSIEVFSRRADMVRRRDHIQSVLDAMPMLG